LGPLRSVGDDMRMRDLRAWVFMLAGSASIIQLLVSLFETMARHA